MTYSFRPQTDNSISLAEYTDHIATHVDCADLDSVAASAIKLRELANNRTFVADYFNQVLTNVPGSSFGFYSSQSAVLHANDQVTVRLNIWPAANPDERLQKLSNPVYSYYDVHDHNFSFMTVGYYGPGYSTRLYECDPQEIVGYVGEHVDVRFVEETSLPQGKVMLYRAFSDIHMQIPPPSFSMSLNLMILDRFNGITQQHYYDIARGEICDYVESTSTKRVSIVECMRYVGDENSKDILERMSRLHPCVRTRWAAFETLAALEPANAERFWQAAGRDRDPLLKHAAQARLKASNR